MSQSLSLAYTLLSQRTVCAVFWSYVATITTLFTSTDNITFYKCDVTKWEEVEAVSKKVIEEVSP